VRQAILALPERAWTPAYDIDGEPRAGAWVAKLTALLDLSKWPDRSRVLVRRERPHPGAQLRFSDADGHRFTAFLTDTRRGGPRRQRADLEVRHRSHARVEDRIRAGKTTGLRNLPCRGYRQNKVWLELALAAADLLTWTQALCLNGELPAANQQRCVTDCSTSPHASSTPADADTSRSTATGPGPTTWLPHSHDYARHPGPPERHSPSPRTQDLGRPAAHPYPHANNDKPKIITRAH